MASIDHKATGKAMTDLVAAFIANPQGWPAAMAARAVRLRSGHPAYSSRNHALIVAQLWGRYGAQGMDDDDAFTAAIRASSQEIAPTSIWKTRGFTPTGPGLAVWSRPILLWVDPVTGEKVPKDTPGAEQRRVFRTERTYLADDVIDEHGHTGQAAFTPPDLPAGDAKEIYDRLTGWITDQGWTVERTGRDIPEGGYTQHATHQIVIHGGLTGWAAVQTLTHEIAHALLHGSDDHRPYTGEHRGDMEAEAESVAFGLMTAYQQHDLAKGSARYATTWARDDPEKVAIAYEKTCHVLDALASVAHGATDVTLAPSPTEERAHTKTGNKALAAALRAAGLHPTGDIWQRAKNGEPIDSLTSHPTAPPDPNPAPSPSPAHHNQQPLFTLPPITPRTTWPTTHPSSATDDDAAGA